MFRENFQKTCWYLEIFAWQIFFKNIEDFECQQINVYYESLYYLNDFNVQTYFDYLLAFNFHVKWKAETNKEKFQIFN